MTRCDFDLRLEVLGVKLPGTMRQTNAAVSTEEATGVDENPDLAAEALFRAHLRAQIQAQATLRPEAYLRETVMPGGGE